MKGFIMSFFADKRKRKTFIEGGCHAFFGMYGAQDGDGTPRITNEEQIYRTAELIAELIFEEKAPASST